MTKLCVTKLWVTKLCVCVCEKVVCVTKLGVKDGLGQSCVCVCVCVTKLYV